MKILHLCSFSGNLGDYIRIRKIDEYLQLKGNDVRFLNLPATRYPRRKLLSRPDILKAIIVGKIHLEKTELIKEKLRLTIGLEALREQIDSLRPDVVFCEGIFPALVAIHTFEDSVPLVVDVHGIISAEYEMNPFGNVVKEKTNYLREIEGLVYRRSSGIIAISDPMRTYISQKFGVESKRIFVVPNGSEIRQQVAQYREPLTVIYGGIFCYWENIDSYLDLAKRNRECPFYLIGDGPLKNHILQRIRNERINVHYLGYLRYSDSIVEFSRRNIGVAPSVKGLVREFGYPIKVFDYLSCGLPVIVPGFLECAKVISRHKCGFVTKTSNAEEFDECLRTLDRSNWEEMSLNGLRLIREEFNWNLLLRKLDEIVEPLK